MTTRADFAKIADVLHGFVGRKAVEPDEIVLALAALFADENEHFNGVVFLRACGYDAAQANILASEIGAPS